MKKTVIIRASELAAVAGKHPFRPQQDEIRRIRAQIHGGTTAEKHEQSSQKLGSYMDETVLETAAALGVANGERAKITDAVRATEAATRAVTATRAATQTAQKQLALAKRDVTVPTSLKRELSTVTANANLRAAESAAKAARLEQSRAQKRQSDVQAELLPDIKHMVVQDIDTRCLTAAKRNCDVRDIRELAKLPVRAVVNQHSRMAQGTVSESSILLLAQRKYERLADVKPPSSPSPSIDIGEFDIEDCTYVAKLVGTCDAISEDCVVEIKNRKSRLFRRLAEYEAVQLLAYLKLYKRASGVLIEHFESELAEQWCNDDDELWKQVVDATICAVRAAVDQKNPS